MWIPKLKYNLTQNLILINIKKIVGEKGLNSDGSEPICDRCGNPIDDCKCVCPYCGESSGCECCIGSDKATGG